LLSSAQAQHLPTVLVLASGRGARFNASGGTGHKLQADLCGRTVLERTLDAVRASGLQWHLEDAGHPGMGDTIAAAVRATRGAAGWLVLPGDLPLISPQTLVDLALLQTPAQVVVPVFAGQRGHPVRFAPACGEALGLLSGSQGAAALMDRFEVLRWPVLDAGCITDIDSLDDLVRARGLMQG
jgi:molybdenum cofactor cytidylyltransferase